MKKLVLTAALGAASLALAGCGGGDTNTANGAATADDANGAATVEGGAEGNGAGTASNWPQGARIVEEDGVTYRIDPDGNRVRLTETDARIVVENGMRYRVEPSGTRVRIDDRGVDVDLDGPDVPGIDVDIGTNPSGNLDVDVNTSGGDATPDR